ncbi:MAG: hypothetical protein DDT18_00499 [Actinobacteria bacterium]|nr:hypothetical protein [Actinomycetota bacterium]
MAIARMKKVYIMGHQSIRGELLEGLQEAELVHIANLREKIEPDVLDEAEIADQEELGSLHLKLSKVGFVLDQLGRFYTEKKGFLSSLIKEKVVVSLEDLKKVEEKLNFEQVYAECEALENEFVRVLSNLRHLEEQRKSLVPWLGLDLKIEDIRDTRETGIITGKLPVSNFKKFSSDIESELSYTCFNTVSEDGRNKCLFIIYHREEEGALASILGRHGFQEVTFPGLKDTPEIEYRKIQKETGALEKRRDEIREQIQGKASYREGLLVFHDYLQSLVLRKEVGKKFATTDQVFLIEGWVKEKNMAAASELVSEASDTIDISYSDPAPDEEPPVILENNRWIEPFEVITEVYGAPHPKELDPTPYTAPFFLVAFGLALGDVGYGLVLSLLSWLLLKKIPLGKMGQKFLRLLIYGGVAAVVAGVLTGGWFAIPSESLPPVLKNLRLFDPLSPDGLITFLLVSFGFGFLQLFLGVFLEMVDNFRRGKVLDGLIDQGSVLMFLPGAALMVIWMFWSGNNGGTPLWAKVGLVLIITASLLTVFFRNRQSKSLLGRVGGGLYSLYQMSSFLGDTVSYARLMALGIATTMIGWAFNILGGMIMAVPVVGIIIGSLLLVFLHAISLMINLIGAVVHPLRLQYVEFFTKFFEGGGEGFRPFSIFTKNVILRSKGG